MNHETAGINIDIDKLQPLAPKFVSMSKFPVGCKVLYNLRCSHEAKFMQATSARVEEVYMHFENGRRVYKVKMTPETSDAHDMYFYEDQLVYGIGFPVRISKIGTDETSDGVVLISEREKGIDGVQKVVYTVQYSDSGENDITIESRISADRVKYRGDNNCGKGTDGNESTSITNVTSQPGSIEEKEAENSPNFSAAKSCSNSEYSCHNSHDTSNRDQVSARKRSCVYYDVEHAKIPKREVKCEEAKGELKAENIVSIQGSTYDYISDSGESRNSNDCGSNGAEEQQRKKDEEDEEDVSDIDTEEEDSDDEDFTFDRLEEEEDNDDEMASLEDPLLPAIDGRMTSSVETADAAREEPELSSTQEDPETSITEVSSQVLSPNHDAHVEPSQTWHATCTKDHNQLPVSGVPQVGVDGDGCTNIAWEDGTIPEQVSRFLNRHNVSKYPDDVADVFQYRKHQDFQKFQGRIRENGAIQTMCQTRLVEGSEDMKDITLFHVMAWLWEKNYCHFPDANDVFSCDGKNFYLSKVWLKKLDDEGRVTGYSSVVGKQKDYPRISKIMYTFHMDAEGQITLLQQYNFMFRVHVWEKFQMIHRLMILGVPRDYVLDPYENVWYLVLKHGKYVRNEKNPPKRRGVVIRNGNSWINLEVSHLDHSKEGLNFLRIETKDKNLSRVVPCFSTIKCKECGYEVQGNCTHNPICRNTFEILCRECVINLGM